MTFSWNGLHTIQGKMTFIVYEIDARRLISGGWIVGRLLYIRDLEEQGYWSEKIKTSSNKSSKDADMLIITIQKKTKKSCLLYANICHEEKL